MFRLFKRKPRLDSADSQLRMAALKAQGDDQQDAFARLFLHDADRDVRLAALGRLTRLETVLAGLDDDAVAEPAAARLLALIDDDTPATIRSRPAVLGAALASAETPAEALRIAAWTDDVGHRAAAVCGSPRAAVRLGVAEATWDPALLAEMEKRSRGRDKSMHRIARDRLAEWKAANAERDAQDAEAEKLIAAAAALAAADPHYDARRDAIERDWTRNREAAETTDQQLARYGAPPRDAGAGLPARREPPPAEPEPDSVDFDALVARAEALRDSAAALAPADGDAELDADALAACRQSAEALANEWDAGIAAQPSRDAPADRFQDAMAAARRGMAHAERAARFAADAGKLLRADLPRADDAADVDAAAAAAAADAAAEVAEDAEAKTEDASLAARSREIDRRIKAIDRLQDRHDWPADLPRPGAVAALAKRRGELVDAARHCAERVEALAGDVEALLAQARASVESGAAVAAGDGHRRLRDLVRLLPREDAQRYQADLAEIGAAVRKLREWRDYAEAPKREALCQRIETLADEPLEVHEQIEAVKSLRGEWNALAPADAHRDRELRKRFDRAAERAFEPCRVYFKEQAEQRAFNLDQRRAIVAVLEDYLEDNDWEQADWRGVERVLRQARAEWRSYHPVDRKAGRALAARFEELAARLHGYLKDEWDRNIERKQAIVDEAASVRGSGDPATAKAEAMKELQRRWKRIGPVPRRVDQRLWKLFRDECEVVFASRDAVHDRHSQRRRAIDEAEALLAELTRRVDIDPGLSRNTVADYEHRLHELGALPNDLMRRANALLQDADRMVAERQMAARERDADEE